MNMIGSFESLMAAIENNEIPKVKEILDFGVVNTELDDMNVTGHTPLILAVWCHSAECVELLCRKGVDVNKAGSEAGGGGSPPLVVACYRRENAPIIDILVKYGADVNLRHPNAPTALHALAYADLGTEDTIHYVGLLLGAGADVNYPVLHFFELSRRNPEFAQLLLDAGCDTSAVDDKGRRLHRNFTLKRDELDEILEREGCFAVAEVPCAFRKH